MKNNISNDYNSTGSQKKDSTALTPVDIANTLFKLLDDSGNPLNLDEEGQIALDVSAGAKLIPLKEWALRNGITPATARQKAGRGMLKTARKVGRDWMISPYEPNIDHRSKDGLLSIEGPIHIDKVLNYLFLLDANTLPDHWIGEEHESFCRNIFFSLRNQLTGNQLILFDLICDAMESQQPADIYYLPHEEIIDNILDPSFEGSDFETIDFPDYLNFLANVASDLAGHFILLNSRHLNQTILMPWLRSMTWKNDKNDGLYFIPANFFLLIFREVNP